MVQRKSGGHGNIGNRPEDDPHWDFHDDRFLNMLKYAWEIVQEIENERLGRRFGLWDAKLDGWALDLHDTLKEVHEDILAYVMAANASRVRE
jgi:hypothetical protein